MIKHFDPTPYLGQTVRVHRNLNNGLMSVSYKFPGKGWLLLGHIEQVAIAQVQLLVYETQRQTMVNKGRRAVHAYAQGTLLAHPPAVDLPIALAYNPFLGGTFVNRLTATPIYTCQYLVATSNPRSVLVSDTGKTQPLQLSYHQLNLS